MTMDLEYLRNTFSRNVLCAVGLDRHIGNFGNTEQNNCQCHNLETKKRFAELVKSDNIGLKVLNEKGLSNSKI